MLNHQDNAIKLGKIHCAKLIGDKLVFTSFILIHNPSVSFISDITECVLERYVGYSRMAKGVASLITQKVLLNKNTVELILHSQGSLIGTSALNIISNDLRIGNLNNLVVEYHGSPVNILTAYHTVNSVGAKWGGMYNHQGDMVGVVLGHNSINRATIIYSLFKAPSLFFDIDKHPNGYLKSEHTYYYNH